MRSGSLLLEVDCHTCEAYMGWILDFLGPDCCCLQQDREWSFLCCSWIGFELCVCWKNITGCLFDLYKYIIIWQQQTTSLASSNNVALTCVFFYLNRVCRIM